MRILATLAALLTTSGGCAMAETGQPARILYRCEAPAGFDSAPLCAAFRDALAERAPGATLDPADGGTAPAGDAALALLRIGRVTPHSLTGHVEWHATGRAPETGPEASVDVIDAGLTPGAYPQFVAVLLRLAGRP
jgi:hypothetical protein